MNYVVEDSEECGSCSFCDEAVFIDKNCFIAVFFGSFDAGQYVWQKVQGFYAAAFPSQVGAGADGYTVDFGNGIVGKLCYRHEEIWFQGFGSGVIS